MEYSEEFTIGKYGAHAGPAARIINTYVDYSSEAFDKGCDLDIEITKISCPYNHQVGQKIDGESIIVIMSLMGIEGSRFKVTAKYTGECNDKNNLLERCVKDIGRILTNTEKYTIRPHP